jgi:hypothetical protein
VIEAAIMDRRWQLVLDCLDADRPPFREGARTQRAGAGSDDGRHSRLISP